jgi:hypothetical protein
MKQRERREQCRVQSCVPAVLRTPAAFGRNSASRGTIFILLMRLQQLPEVETEPSIPRFGDARAGDSQWQAIAIFVQLG